MLLSSLKKVLNHELSFTHFKEEISDEVANYKKLLGKKGANIPIHVREDIDLLFIDINQLLEATRTGHLDKYESSYIADALTLSESFKNFNDQDAYLIESLILS